MVLQMVYAFSLSFEPGFSDYETSSQSEHKAAWDL